MNHKKAYIICAMLVLAAFALIFSACHVEIDIYNVQLSQNYVELSVGETVVLEATVTPTTKRAVTWSSIHSDVATVQDGLVTAVGVGATTVTATLGGVNGNCTIVVRGETDGEDGLILDKSEITLEVGQMEIVTASFTESETEIAAVQWSSLDDGIAFVKTNETGRGVIRAVSVGLTVVTAVADGHIAVCKVNVVKSYVPATGMSINYNYMEMTVGTSRQLVTTVFPSNATNQTVELRSADNSVANVDSSGHVYALKVGATVIVATVDDIQAECVVVVNPPEIDVRFKTA